MLHLLGTVVLIPQTVSQTDIGSFIQPVYTETSIFQTKIDIQIKNNIVRIAATNLGFISLNKYCANFVYVLCFTASVNGTHLWMCSFPCDIFPMVFYSFTQFDI